MVPEPVAFSPPGLDRILILPPHGKLSLTPATRMAVDAIGSNRALLRGHGIDWGSGSGVLTITAAKVPAVKSIVGLELDPDDLEIATANAVRNAVADKITFLRSDSFAPFADQDVSRLTALVGSTDFLVANPPASRGDDGLGWRRSLLRGAREFLRPGAPLFIQISYQYNVERIARLAEDVAGYTYEGVIGSSDWIEFDQRRTDLSTQLVEYADEEAAGGTVYTFGARGEQESDHLADAHMSATEALRRYRATGESPLSKWQMHLFRRQRG